MLTHLKSRHLEVGHQTVCSGKATHVRPLQKPLMACERGSFACQAAAATEWAKFKAQEKRPRDWKGPKNGLRLWLCLTERLHGWEEMEETHGMDFASKQLKNPSEEKVEEMQKGLVSGFEGMMGDTFKAIGGGLPALLAEEGVLKGSGMQTFEAADPAEGASAFARPSDVDMPLVSSLLDKASAVPVSRPLCAPRHSVSSIMTPPSSTSASPNKKRSAEWPAGVGDSVDSKGSGRSGESDKSDKKRAKQQNQLPVHRLTAVGAWRSAMTTLLTSLKGGLDKSVIAKAEIDEVVRSTIEVRKQVQDPSGMGTKEKEVLNEYLKALEIVQGVVMATVGEGLKPLCEQVAELSKVKAQAKEQGCRVCDDVEKLQCLSAFEAEGLQRLDSVSDVDGLAEAKEPRER